MEGQSYPVRPLPPGATIGPYTVIRQIPSGVGGMAIVYEARLRNRGGSVALKVAHSGLGSFLKDEAAFLKSVQLNHPHIIKVLPTPLGGGSSDYIVKDPETGCWYFAMEYMAGGSLADWLARRRRIPFPKAMEVLQQIGEALDAAHQAGILHLDVKPSNILFREDPERKKIHAVLTDFGIARPVGRAASGQTTLTVEYASPEQARLVAGEPAEIGPASDLYSLSVVFYEMITGRLPFRAETEIALLYQIVHEEPDLSSPPLSPSVASVLSRALSKDPGQRPPSAAALVRELEKAASEGVPPVAESTRQRSPSGGRVWLGAVLGLLLGFILGFPAGWYLGRQGETAGGSLGTTPTATTSTLLPSWLTPPLTEGVTLSPMPTTSAPTRRIPTSTPIPPTPTPTPRPPATPTPTPTPGG